MKSDLDYVIFRFAFWVHISTGESTVGDPPVKWWMSELIENLWPCFVTTRKITAMNLILRGSSVFDGTCKNQPVLQTPYAY